MTSTCNAHMVFQHWWTLLTEMHNPLIVILYTIFFGRGRRQVFRPIQNMSSVLFHSFSGDERAELYINIMLFIHLRYRKSNCIEFWKKKNDCICLVICNHYYIYYMIDTRKYSTHTINMKWVRFFFVNIFVGIVVLIHQLIIIAQDCQLMSVQFSYFFFKHIITHHTWSPTCCAYCLIVRLRTDSS